MLRSPKFTAEQIADKVVKIYLPEEMHKISGTDFFIGRFDPCNKREHSFDCRIVIVQNKDAGLWQLKAVYLSEQLFNRLGVLNRGTPLEEYRLHLYNRQDYDRMIAHTPGADAD